MHFSLQHSLFGFAFIAFIISQLICTSTAEVGASAGAVDTNYWFGYSNLCGAAVPTPKQSTAYVTYFGDFESYADCEQACVAKSNVNTRNICQSFTYYSSNNSADAANHMACYGRMNDPLWLPCNHTGVVSAEMYWPCASDLDCSLNGKCDVSDGGGNCVCRPAWKGKRCQLLNTLPASKEGTGFKGKDTSSWGGSVLRDDTDAALFHMFLSYFPNHCGHQADTMNSHVAHAVSQNGFQGPYAVVEQVAQEWSHEPFSTRGPNGEYVVFFSYTRNEPFWPILCNCTATNNNGTTPESCCTDTPNACTYHKPANLTRHTTVMRYKNASDINSLGTPWSDIAYLWPVTETGPTNQDTNFVGLIADNGTLFGMNRMWTAEKGSVMYFVTADDWKDTSTYVEHFTETLFPQWVYPGNEDQFLYRDGDGYYHLLFHNMIPGIHGGHTEYYCGAHACSQNGFDWTFFGYAYDNNVTYDDGTHHVFMSRERPHLIFAADGVTPIALVNGALYDGNVYDNDRSFTMLQPVVTPTDVKY